MASPSNAKREGRPPRPWKQEGNLRIDMTPEEFADAVLSGKGVQSAEGEQ